MQRKFKEASVSVFTSTKNNLGMNINKDSVDYNPSKKVRVLGASISKIKGKKRDKENVFLTVKC